MSATKYTTVEERKHNEYPILIVDQEGHIGVGVYEELKERTTVLLVSGKEPKFTENLIFLHYKKRIPEIPNNIYSHIFFIWNGNKESYELLPEFLRKAKNDNSKIIFVFSYKYFAEELVSELLELYKGVTFVILGDVFGNDITRERVSIIDELVFEAKSIGTMHVRGMGIENLYPVLFADAVTHILQAAFGIHHKTTFFIASKHPITQLSIAHLLQKTNPLLRLDFTMEREKVFVFSHEVYTYGEWVLGDGYPVEEKVKKLYEETVITKEQAIVVESLPKKRSEFIIRKSRTRRLIPQSTKRGIGLFFLASGLLFILLPLLGILLGMSFGTKSLYDVKQAIDNGKLHEATINAGEANDGLSLAQTCDRIFTVELDVLGLGDSLLGVTQNLSTEKMIASDVRDILSGIEKMKLIFAGTDPQPRDDFLATINSIKQAMINFQVIAQNHQLPSYYLDKIHKLDLPLTYFANTEESYASLLGMDTPKSYVILFQNNMELRPGGGFIGSYGIANLDKGKMGKFAIADVYDADGQLKEHIEPPFPIRRYMPLPHLYLRDSTFDVDFTKSAALAAILLREETGKQVDGVIGVDLSFMKSILEVVGGVYIPEYNQTVTPDNFFLLTEEHAEKNTFGGSTQKKDFLRSLFNAMQAKFGNSSNISYISLLDKIAIDIKQKHILFAFADPVYQNLYTVNGMSSALWDPRPLRADTINDFVGINEANLGVNKANYFLKRGISHTAVIDDKGNVSEEVHVTYTNTSQKNQWPGGDYKNYMRVILPLGTKLTSITIDGQNQKIVPTVTDFRQYEQKNFIPPAGLEVDAAMEENKTVYGFLTIVPAQGTRNIVLSYSLPQKIDTAQSQLHYSLNVFKQPGTDNDPYSFSLQYPPLYKVLSASSGVTNTGQSETYLTNLAADQEVTVDFTKK